MDLREHIHSAMAKAAGGDPGGASKSLLTLLRRHPGDRDVSLALGRVLAGEGKHDQARYHLERAAFAKGLHLAAAQELAKLEHQHGKPGACLAVCTRVIDSNPQNEPLASGIVGTLLLWGRLAEAERLSEIASNRMPGSVQMGVRRAAALFSLGRVSDAMPVLDSLPQDEPLVIEAKADMSNYDASLSAQEVSDCQRRLGALIGESARQIAQPFQRAKPSNTRQRLRIGFISPDFRTTAVAYFARAAMAGLDSERFEVVGLYNASVHDNVTEHYRAICHEWHEVAGQNDRELARFLRSLDLDIIVDLTGYAGEHRMLTLGTRVAPVQLTCIGYPNTTGLGAMDYRLVDAITDPEDAQRLATERLVRLERCFLCFDPMSHQADVTKRDPSSPVVFGSFNKPKKLTDKTLSLWADVIAAVPGSGLLLKALEFSDTETRSAILGRLERAGIDAGRVQLVEPTADRSAHLDTYNRVDIALDTIPYNGTTTTCDALWMGVPVIGLLGDRHAARVTASLLNAVGLDDLIAGTREEYVRIASELAQDRVRLASLRSGLRTRMAESPLCDERSYGDAFGRLLKELADSIG